MSSQTNAPVMVSINPTPQKVGAEEEEQKGSSLANDVASLMRAVQQMQRSMVEQQQQSQQRADEQLRLLDELRRARKPAVSIARRSMSPTAATTTYSPQPDSHYSASAALPRPPVMSHHRKSDIRRQSIGVPSSAFIETPRTPAPKLARMDRSNTDSEEDTADDESHNGMPAYDKRMAQVRKSMTSIIKTFHGQTNKDTYTVIDWVEKIDTEFSIQMGQRQEGRLDIVRSMLAGTALKWMNRKLQELNEKAADGELDEDIEWDMLRQPFIDAHLGINTIETFKAQLRSLKLGGPDNQLTPTPVELNKEFDHLAELAYPDRRSDIVASD